MLESSSISGDDQMSLYTGSMALVAVHRPLNQDCLSSPCKSSSNMQHLDTGKYVRYTAEQVQVLERLYNECPKPSSLRRQQLMRENPVLQNIEPKQIKVWFQNRRCREKQRKESYRLQTVNAKLTAMNKLLMEENDRLRKQVAQLLYENGYIRQQLQHGGITTDTSCDSVVTSGLQHLSTPHHQHSPQDATYSGILSLAEEILSEFLAKATGTAIDWVQMPGMKPGPDSTEMVNILHGSAGTAARACGLVSLEPAKLVVEVFKDKMAWNRHCRRVATLYATTTSNGGVIEVLYTQMFAPTTLASARDFYTLRYTSMLEDGSIVVCERSISSLNGTPTAPLVQPFVRAYMHASGSLVRQCEGSGSIVIIVDHMELEALSVPEVLRPLYNSSSTLAQGMTMAALKHLRHLAKEGIPEVLPGQGQQPAAVRALSHRLVKGFNNAVNTFIDEGWTLITCDGADDVTLMVKAPSTTTARLHNASKNILCAKASMLLQNVPPSLLVSFLREHRSEWAVNTLEEAMEMGNPGFSCFNDGLSKSKVLRPQVHALEEDEFLELMKMEDYTDNIVTTPSDMFLLQLCSGLEGNGGTGSCSQLIFAPVDASISDDMELVPSGFRAIPLESSHPSDPSNSGCRTLDLTSSLEVGPLSSFSKSDSDNHFRSVLTIAFQFCYESHMQESVVSMAQRYVHNVLSTVQRVALALSPNRQIGHQLPAPSWCPPDRHLLARSICKSYKLNLGMQLVSPDVESSEEYLKSLWKLGDAVICCAYKTVVPVFTFANQAGLEMLEASSIALQELEWDKTLDENSRKSFCSVFGQVMQQGYACLPSGIRVSRLGRTASYERAIAWKVVEEDGVTVHGVAFLYINWSLLHRQQLQLVSFNGDVQQQAPASPENRHHQLPPLLMS